MHWDSGFETAEEGCEETDCCWLGVEMLWEALLCEEETGLWSALGGAEESELFSVESSLETDRLEDEVKSSLEGVREEPLSPPAFSSVFCRRIAPAARAVKTRTAAAMIHNFYLLVIDPPREAVC